MLVKIEDPGVLLRAVDIISDLVLEVRIKINEFGLSITAMDPANVAMVSFKLPKSSFSQFETGEEVLGVNLEDFKRILKRCGKGGALILEKIENTLHIQIQDRVKRNFTLNLIEIDSEDKEMPELEYSTKVTITSTDLIDAVEDGVVVADACSFLIEEGKFIIEAKSMNSAKAEFSGDEVEIQAENCKSRYSLDYLQKFLKAAKSCEKTILKFANDHPLKLIFKNTESQIDFILAPRVETED